MGNAERVRVSHTKKGTTSAPGGDQEGTSGVHKGADRGGLAVRAHKVVEVANGAVSALHVATVLGLGAAGAGQAGGGTKGGAVGVLGAGLASVGTNSGQRGAGCGHEEAGAAAEQRAGEGEAILAWM